MKGGLNIKIARTDAPPPNSRCYILLEKVHKGVPSKEGIKIAGLFSAVLVIHGASFAGSLSPESIMMNMSAWH